MSAQEFLLIIRGRWRVVLSIFGLVTLAALGVSLLMPIRYTATASVLVDAVPDPVASAIAVMPLAELMQTQEDIASSERVAQRVVTTLKLEDVPEFRQRWQNSTGGRGDFGAWLAAMLLKSFSVPPTVESNVLTLSAKWADAKFAATLANAFAQAFIDTTLDLKMQPATQYAKSFDESARALRADVEYKQKLLSDYENSNGILSADERLDVESTRLMELSSQLVAIQGQLQESQSRQRQPSAGDDARPEILQNALIASLKAELSRIEAHQQELATKLGTSHPEYLRSEAEVASLRQRLAGESARVIASLGAATEVNQRRENELSAALVAQKQRVLELKHQRDEAAILRNDVLTAQRNLDAVTQRLAQSNLQTRTPLANVALLTAATEPTVRSSPNLLLNLVIGMVLGAIGGVGTALWRENGDRRIRSDAELIQLLGLPLLCKINAITDERRPSLAAFNARRALTN